MGLTSSVSVGRILRSDVIEGDLRALISARSPERSFEGLAVKGALLVEIAVISTCMPGEYPEELTFEGVL